MLNPETKRLRGRTVSMLGGEVMAMILESPTMLRLYGVFPFDADGLACKAPLWGCK